MAKRLGGQTLPVRARARETHLFTGAPAVTPYQASPRLATPMHRRVRPGSLWCESISHAALNGSKALQDTLRGSCPHSADTRCLPAAPLWHFTAARPFAFRYPRQVEASDLHGRVPTVRPTLEEQIDQAFAGSVRPSGHQ
jgi:hypothetical protein